jgi:ubiquinone/menaquinone biosynthesis C-methylase UbiE
VELVAEAFGADPELVPHLPGLLTGIDALGGWPDEVVASIAESADLPEQAKVVDLGCGKGAIAIAIARAFGHRVQGVDLFEPFLRAAIDASGGAGVGQLCTFELGRIEDVIDGSDSFDLVVFSAVGAGMFGGYADCIAALRRCVRPGGYLVLCEGFLDDAMPTAALPAGYEYYEPHDQAIRQLTAHGDILARETLVPRDEITRQTIQEMEVLRENAQWLSAAKPQHRELLESFIDSQNAEYEFVNRATREVVWLLRRV